MEIDIRRSAGHPWDNRPGFDLMLLESRCERLVTEAKETAERKFWKAWIVGKNEQNGKFSAVMYKPSGQTREWDDGPQNPHPGNKA